MITWKNYEEYMMMHADGELTPAEEQALMSFLFEHPELQRELAAFSMAKLIPETTVVYADKKSLVKPVADKKIIGLPVWQRYAVAAGVAAILFLSFYKLTTSSDDNTPVIAAATPTKPVDTMPQVAATIATAATVATIQPESTATAAAVKTKTNTRPKVTKQLREQSPVQQTAIAQIQDHNDNAVHPMAIRNTWRRDSAITAVAITTPKTFSAETVTNVPSLAIHIEEEEGGEETSLIDKLPIGDLKKKGMEQVANAVTSGYDKINTIRQEISATTISLKIEKRKLIVSF